MRIGIDIRKYNDFGIGTYIQNLMKVFSSRADLEPVYFASDDVRSMLDGYQKGEIVINNSSKYSLKELISISSMANKQKLDVFHAPHYTFPLNLKIPSVVTVHDIIHLRMKQHYSLPKRSYAYFMIRHACMSATAIIVDSQYGKNEIRSLFDIPEDKIRVNPLGVDHSFFAKISQDAIEFFKRKHHITKQYILYTGSLKPHKNIPILLKAFKILSIRHDIQLVFAGEKISANPQLDQIVHDLQLTETVIDLGRIDQIELQCVYQSAVAVVLPSLYEGFGFSMIEAMASGVPAIGADSTSIPEVVGTAGLLFNPYDATDLANKIESVLTDPTLKTEMIKKGYERASLFSWSACAERTVKTYQEVIS